MDREKNMSFPLLLSPLAHFELVHHIVSPSRTSICSNTSSQNRTKKTASNQSMSSRLYKTKKKIVSQSLHRQHHVCSSVSIRIAIYSSSSSLTSLVRSRWTIFPSPRLTATCRTWSSDWIVDTILPIFQSCLSIVSSTMMTRSSFLRFSLVFLHFERE